jgi:hypothetical protein
MSKAKTKTWPKKPAKKGKTVNGSSAKIDPAVRAAAERVAAEDRQAMRTYSRRDMRPEQ